MRADKQSDWKLANAQGNQELEKTTVNSFANLLGSLSFIDVLPAHAKPADQGLDKPDLITVQGEKVGYMYRKEPDNDTDSGWRFMAGHESQSYMDDPDNLAVYDVNTIANYDPEIIPFLDAPPGSAFARDEDSGEFEEVEYEPME